MAYVVDVRRVEAQPIAVVRGRGQLDAFPQTIRALFEEFNQRFQCPAGPNIAYYPSCEHGVFEIECGALVERDGNSATPAGRVATTTYFGPYDRLGPVHAAFHQWCFDHGHTPAGPFWEIYGPLTDDPAQLRTDIYYLLKD